MRRPCQYDAPLWTLAFAAAFLGIGIRSLRALIDDRTIGACYPYAGNQREMRVMRSEVLRYADILRSGDQVARVTAPSHPHDVPAYDARIRHGRPRSIEQDAQAMYRGMDIMLNIPS